MRTWMGCVVLAALAAGCATLDANTLTYTRADIAKQAILDRRDGGYAEVLKGIEGVGLTGPDVGFATRAGRLELTWTARPGNGALGIPLSVSLTISGVPELNTGGDGIDLAEARVERVRLPLIGLAGTAPRAEQPLGRLPLLLFDDKDLNRGGVLYRADSVAVGSFGLRVKLVRK